MFDLIYSEVADLQGFLRHHSEQLQNASLLLGGKPALQETRSLIDDICNSTELNNRQRRGLARLHDLLTLEYVHDHSRPEAAYFADIDPEGVYVADLCILADSYQDILLKLESRFGNRSELTERLGWKNYPAHEFEETSSEIGDDWEDNTWMM